MDVKLLVDDAELFSGKFSNINKYVSDFLSDHSDAKVISFVDELPPLFENNHRCLMWRSAFDYEVVNAVNAQAYKDLDLFHSDSYAALGSCMDAFYHDYAVILFKLMIYKKCRADLTNNVLFIVPSFINAAEKHINKRGTQQRFNFNSKVPSVAVLNVILFIPRTLAAIFNTMKVALAKVHNSNVFADIQNEDFRGVRRRIINGLTLSFKFNLKKNTLSLGSILGSIVVSLSLTILNVVLFIPRVLITMLLIPNVVLFEPRVIPGRVSYEKFWVSYENFRVSYESFRASCENFRMLYKIESRKLLQNNKKGDNVIVITIEDSGSLVNLNPAVYIIEKLRNEINIVILTSSTFVERKIKEECEGIAVINVSNINNISVIDYLYHNTLSFLKKIFTIRNENFPNNIDTDFIYEVKSRYVYYTKFLFCCHRALDLIQRHLNVKLVFSIYEVLPIAVSAGRWAKSHDISWLGFFPILSGDRPDGYYFPADRHLVYGHQLADMISSVKSGADIDVVGSPTYDPFVGRNKAEDIALVNSLFPAKGNKKMVVVATEAFSDPLTEMGPVLRSLSKMKNVFVVVKVHPKDSVDYFRFVSSEIDENIEVVGIVDLGALLNSSDLLICILSNLIISAAILGTPTLSCDFSGKRKVIDFVEENLCFGCNKVEEIDSIIENLLCLGKESSVIKQKLKQGIVRFNGPNDGQSHSRIKDILLEYL